MKIVADENIPHACEAFAPFGTVKLLPGRNLHAEHLQDCDCLLVRSITRVDRELLQGSRIRFVASATIGTDHVDLEYLREQGIGFANAPGCNAESAAEYVINVLFHLAQRKGFDPFKLRAGIVGYGNVGSRVKQKLDALEIDCLVNDPPLQDAGDDRVNYVSLQTIIDECDFITLHVPLTRAGAYPTWHLLDRPVLEDLIEETILFNAARGPIVDNRALSNLLDSRDDLTVFLDTWENEPVIDQRLLRQVDFGTPHIAGYSVEGKLRGTQMIMNAASEFFAIESSWTMQDYLPEKQLINLGADPGFRWPDLFYHHYDVAQDYRKLLALAALAPDRLATEFDQLRKHYPARYEYQQYRVSPLTDKKTASQIERLLFAIA